jgi:PhzF family phenazine biosynthesis protein
MSEQAMFQVDAFTDRVFGGNPAAVLVLDRWPDDALMQAVAAENNLTETAFVVRNGRDWGIRWFTPVHEVAFCGHATLASAHVLATEYGVEGPIAFATRKVGVLTASPAGRARYALDFPRIDPEPAQELPSGLSALFPAGWTAVFRNFENWFVAVEDADAVAAFVPDLTRIAALGTQGLAVTGAGSVTGRAAADFTSRYFAPGVGIPEDPVTGSIHATLAPYWAGRLGRERLTAHQASARGGELACRIAGGRVIVEGSAVTYLSGRIILP